MKQEYQFQVSKKKCCQKNTQPTIKFSMCLTPTNNIPIQTHSFEKVQREADWTVPAKKGSKSNDQSTIELPINQYCIMP